MHGKSFKLSRRWYLLAFAALAVVNSGCLVAAAGAAAGAGGAAVYAHYRGVDTNTFDADVTTVAKSTEDALYDLGMPVVNEKHANNNSVTVKSTTGTGDNVTIEVEPETAKIPTDPVRTKVSVRIAMFGDHEVGMRIMHRIDQRVASNHSAVPATPVVPAPGTPAVSSAKAAAPVVPASASGAAAQNAPVVPASANGAAAQNAPVVPAAPPANGPTPPTNTVVPASATAPGNWKPAQ